MLAAPSGSPGCPEFACSTSSTAKKRSVLMDNSSSTGDDCARSAELVTGKFLSADVIFVHSCFDEHAPHRRHHGWRSGYVIDWALERGQMLHQHIFVDEGGLALPFALRLVHFGHGHNEMKPWILRSRLSQYVQERRIFGPPVGIEQVHLMRCTVVRRLADDTHKGSDSDPTG